MVSQKIKKSRIQSGPPKANHLQYYNNLQFAPLAMPPFFYFTGAQMDKKQA